MINLVLYILRIMRIRFVRNVLVDIQKTRLQEVWEKYFNRWEELNIESVNYSYRKDSADMITAEGDIIEQVPIDSFEVMQTPKEYSSAARTL